MNDTILKVQNVSKKFGGLVAVSDVSMDIRRGSIHALIGPNGSGKSTILNLVSGLYKLTSGEILFEGQRINGLMPHQVSQQGIGRTFQNIRLFSSMSVLQNCMVGEHFSTNVGFLSTLLGTATAGKAEAKMRQRAIKSLEFLGLGQFLDWEATSLPYGQRRMLEIARAFVMEPKVLLLDEPAAGLNPTETLALSDRLRQINDQGITIVLVEHNMRFVMEISKEITVLNFGRVICEGIPDKVKCEECVIEAYLGEDTDLNFEEIEQISEVTQ